ncbi:MAG: hypothetical protein JO333_11895, partial [Verrucomicrobia bacterium]|nr:hypothetical protein [Verrucomicrobiota bacterium]
RMHWIGFAFSLFLILPSFGGEAVLLKGAVYYDSQNTFRDVVAFTLLKDDDSINHLIKIGHISTPTEEEQNVVVYYAGSESDSPAEFAFLTGPTTYWTFAKYLSNSPKASATASPSPVPEISETTPTASPLPEATPEASPSPSWHFVIGMPGESSRSVLVPQKRVRRRSEEDNGAESNGGRKIWHLVNGQKKWYYEKRPPKEVREAQQGKAPRATFWVRTESGH